MKRTYTKEFKQQARELVKKDGNKHAVTVEKPGITPNEFFTLLSVHDFDKFQRLAAYSHQSGNIIET